MSLITPEFGLFFWMLLAFGLLLLILKKVAWKPILQGLNDREGKISEALRRAKVAQEEVEKLQQSNAEMQREAAAERERMVAEAKAMREQILAQAQAEARQQGEAFMAQARQAMRQEEAEMRRHIRREVVELSIVTAERVLREHFSNAEAQKEHIDRLLEEILKEAK
ncbi:MAG: ATP synthase F0 subunit B [Bacteroidia bacterium]|nr:MAG: ATP synthase F0 subunit B [Bacteroidia bacterium]